MTYFYDITEKWKTMPRGTADEVAAADMFYDAVVLPLVAQNFIARYKDKTAGYKTLFLTLGTSWQPLALSILLHRPQIVIFLATGDVAQSAGIIIDFVNMPQIKYEIKIVDKGDSNKLLQNVSAVYEALDDKKSVCMDITGGTKAMAAAAAMMAEHLGIDVFYIENKFLPLLRKPEPGTEVLVKMCRP